MENSALIIIDIQNDFCNGGPMANTKSIKIIPLINKIKKKFKHVFITRKLHQSNHSSFKEHGGKYPHYCVENTQGANFNEYFEIDENDIVITRGTLQKFDSESAFYDAEEIDKSTNLRSLLQVNNINNLYFCGLNMDTSMFSTIIDAFTYKYMCHVYIEAIGYIDEDMYINKIEYLTKLGINFV
jgi:nicotinamidase/pyrazinamidase